MRARRTSAAALAALLLGAAVAPTAAAGPAPPSAGSTPNSGPSPSTSPATHVVPPKAPKPTDGANSPAAPDPHPPAGGVGPHGEAVGGSRLQSRTLVLPHGAPALPADLTAASWLLVDLDDGDILAARDPHGRYQPASIQKLLTTITLLPLLPGTKRVKVTKTAAATEGSHAGLVGGGTYTIDEIFKALLLVSGNDAAEALAEAAGGRAQTVALMNREAQRLGAYDTYVETPSGLDGWQQLTSAYDMALFLRAALDQPRFVTYDTTLRATLPAQKTIGFGPVQLDNQNAQFLTAVKGALVAKTGFTDAAQHTFVGAIQRHGHRYGVVLLRAQRWPEDQWQQATKLVKWGLSLPKGTRAVGHLELPVAPARPTLQPRPLARTTAAARALRSGTPESLEILAVLALMGTAGAFARRRLRAR